jgi:hypothetical protein
MIKKSIAVCMAVCFFGHAAFAYDTGKGGSEQLTPAAQFVGTTFHGIGLGASIGLAAGWVRYADQHEMQNVWESVGYGALAGLGVGLGAAVLGKESGRGDRALSDIDTAASFGGGAGFLAGTVSALFTGESPRIADGIAWGQLAGCVLGLGAVGYKAATGKYEEEELQEQKDKTRITVELVPGVSSAVKVTRRF